MDDILDSAKGWVHRARADEQSAHNCWRMVWNKYHKEMNADQRRSFEEWLENG